LKTTFNNQPAKKERHDLEYPPFRRDLIDFICTTSSQPERVQKIKERSD
jgi:hypothetical protein